MIAIEQIVRPFVAPSTLAFGRLVSRTVAPSTETAMLTWGQVGTLPSPVQEEVPNTNQGFTIDLCDDVYTETERTVQPLRVTNPDKTTQFVVVDRVKSMSFRVDEKKKLVGAIRSQTTSFNDTGFGDSPFLGTNTTKSDNCKASFNLATP